MNTADQQHTKPRNKAFFLALFAIIFSCSVVFVACLYGTGFYDTHKERALWTAVIALILLILLPLSSWLWYVAVKKDTDQQNPRENNNKSTQTKSKTLAAVMKEKGLSGGYFSRGRTDKPWIAVWGTSAQYQFFFIDGGKSPCYETDSAILIPIDQDNLPEKLHRLRGHWRQPVDAILLLVDEQRLLKHSNLIPVSRLAAQLKWAVPVYAVLDKSSPNTYPDPCTFPFTSLPKWPDIAACYLNNARIDTQNADDLAAWIDQLAHQGTVNILRNRLASHVAYLAKHIENNQTSLLAGMATLVRSLAPQQLLRMIAWRSVSQEAMQPLLLNISQDCRQIKAHKLSLSGSDIAGWVGVGVSVGLIGLMVVSFLSNRSQIQQAKHNLAALTQAKTPVASTASLLALQNQMQLLEQRIAGGTPLHAGWGLNQDAVLLSQLWPSYGHYANRLLAQPTQQSWQRVLVALNDIPLTGNMNNSALVSDNGYRILKAYLMLDQPSKTQTEFLAKQLGDSAVWDNGAAQKQVAQYYADHLPQHPSWRLAAENNAVQGARQTLLTLRGIEQGDDSLYTHILQQAAAKFPPRTLNSLMPGVDARGVFVIPNSLPGEFTRTAWDDYVKGAIEEADPKQGGETTWVLGTQAVKNNNGALHDRLQQRYFAEYVTAWQRFLNSLQWQSAVTLPATIDQLNVVTDPQRSPVSALIDVVQFHGQFGQAERSFASDLLDKTRELVGKKSKGANTVNAAMPDTAREAPPEDPLAKAFKPLLQLSNSTPGQPDNAAASLNLYLATVTSLRLKMQHIANSPDPEAAARQFALLLFKDQPNELSEAQKYAAQLAASLGREWAGFAEQLFVRPLDHASSAVLAPAAANINDMWRQSVQLPWGNEFNCRYPLNSTDNDASLPRLGHYIAPEQGAVAKFIHTYLAGALDQVGEQWVASPTLANANQFDAAFLHSINELSHLSSQLFSHGEAGFRFELMPVAQSGLVRTVLTIDGQSLDYFNQRQSWMPLRWPGDSQKSGTHLTWVSVKSGMQQTLEFSGRWAFLRLLAQAKIEPLDKGQYQLDWTLDDGLSARYILRTESGSGPLVMLKLLQFKMPARVFGTADRGATAGAETS